MKCSTAYVYGIEIVSCAAGYRDTTMLPTSLCTFLTIVLKESKSNLSLTAFSLAFCLSARQSSTILEKSRNVINLCQNFITIELLLGY